MKVLLATALISILMLSPYMHAYSQEEIKSMKASTKSLDIEFMLDAIPEPEKEVKMQINFKQKDLNALQPHVDYILLIQDSNGNTIERIPPSPQPFLHTDPGSITVPYTFKSEGSYKLRIDIVGILFIPLPTESVEFNITVVPEFPIVIGVLATVMALYVVVSRAGIIRV